MEALGLEWQQIVTNIIGFAAFLFLLSKLAWKPILSFMDERREEIASNYRKIEEDKSDLDKVRKEYEDHLAHIQEEASQKIQEAIRQGQDAARRIEDEARSKAQAIVDKAHADTDRMVEEARLQLKNDVIEVGVEAGRKAAMEQLDDSTHRRLVEKFVEELSHVR